MPINDFEEQPVDLPDGDGNNVEGKVIDDNNPNEHALGLLTRWDIIDQNFG